MNDHCGSQWKSKFEKSKIEEVKSGKWPSPKSLNVKPRPETVVSVWVCECVCECVSVCGCECECTSH